MVKPEEALENIEVAIAEVEWYLPMDYAASFDVAKEVLKKQIPMKPIEHKTMNGAKIYICPVCGVHTARKEDYCFKCGQKLEVD